MTVSLALVTGGNKGIGYEIAKQLALAGTKVLLGARNSARGQAAANTLMNEGLDVSFLQIDICDGENIAAAAEHIENAYGRLTFWLTMPALQMPVMVYRVALRQTQYVMYLKPILSDRWLLPRRCCLCCVSHQPGVL